MPISVKCSDCGKSLKAPDSLAGKKAKCPDCGAIVPIPKEAVDAEELNDEPVAKPKPKAKPKPVEEDYDSAFEDIADDEANAPVDESAKRKPCPMCGELIAKTAAKCRYCGEVLDPALRKRSKKKSSAAADDELTGVDIALCILCSNIGCIIGIVAMLRGQSSRGGKMIAIAIGFQFVLGAIFALIEQLNK